MPIDSEEIDLGFLDKLDARWVSNAITAGMLFTLAIDFMKKVGVLSEFMNTLKPTEQGFVRGLVKCRPKEMGENPFD